MPRALVIVADGFEEIEAVTVIDVLRRAGVEVVAAALDGDHATGSHAIRVTCDVPLEKVRASDFDAVILPGGMPGAAALRDSPRVRAVVSELASAGKLVAAICAAPIALDAAGVLRGKRATSYPGFELPSAEYSEDRVVGDGNVVTSRGPGTALEFALELVRRLAGAERAEALAQGMLARV
jgi:4-methyl-5(b-hydroxyethyl)-thiazole monophosphate biosynthesis